MSSAQGINTDAVVIDGVKDTYYEQNGFQFELNPISKDCWANYMTDFKDNTANLTAYGYYAFDDEWVYVYAECKQPTAFAVGERGVYGNCVILANTKPSIASIANDGINPSSGIGDYTSETSGFNRMNIVNLEEACTSESDTVFKDMVYENRTTWYSTWFENVSNDREGVAVKRTDDNKGYGVEVKFKRDSNEIRAMFSVSFRFASASGIGYIMATGGGEMYSYDGMIRVNFDDNVNDPIKIDGTKDAAYDEGNHVKLDLEEAYPVSYHNPDDDLTAISYLRWDNKYIYVCIIANYGRPMVMPANNQHVTKALLANSKVDYISFGMDVNPDETCSIVKGNRAENIWFAMSQNAWESITDSVLPYQYIDNLAALFVSPNKTNPYKANTFHLGANYVYWRNPNLKTSLSEDQKTFTVEYRIRRDSESENFNYSFVVNMAAEDGSGSQLIRSSGAFSCCMRSQMLLMSYADYTEAVVDSASGFAYKDINEVLPTGATVSASDVNSNSVVYQNALDKAGSGKVLSVKTIQFISGDTTITDFNKIIIIGMPIPEGREDEVDLMLYDAVNKEVIDFTYDNGYIYFTTDKLSSYAIIDIAASGNNTTTTNKPESSTIVTDGEDDQDSPTTGESTTFIWVALAGAIAATLILQKEKVLVK